MSDMGAGKDQDLFGVAYYVDGKWYNGIDEADISNMGSELEDIVRHSGSYDHYVKLIDECAKVLTDVEKDAAEYGKKLSDLLGL